MLTHSSARKLIGTTVTRQGKVIDVHLNKGVKSSKWEFLVEWVGGGKDWVEANEVLIPGLEL